MLIQKPNTFHPPLQGHPGATFLFVHVHPKNPTHPSLTHSSRTRPSLTCRTALQGHTGATFLARSRDECPSTGMLACSQETLLLLHSKVLYNLQAAAPTPAAAAGGGNGGVQSGTQLGEWHVANVLAAARSVVLQDVHLTFSRTMSSLQVRGFAISVVHVCRRLYLGRVRQDIDNGVASPSRRTVDRIRIINMLWGQPLT